MIPNSGVSNVEIARMLICASVNADVTRIMLPGSFSTKTDICLINIPPPQLFFSDFSACCLTTSETVSDIKRLLVDLDRLWRYGLLDDIIPLLFRKIHMLSRNTEHDQV